MGKFAESYSKGGDSKIKGAFIKDVTIKSFF